MRILVAGGVVLPIVLSGPSERPKTGWIAAQVLATALLGATAFLWLRPEPLGFLLLPGLIWA